MIQLVQITSHHIASCSGISVKRERGAEIYNNNIFTT